MDRSGAGGRSRGGEREREREPPSAPAYPTVKVTFVTIGRALPLPLLAWLASPFSSAAAAPDDGRRFASLFSLTLVACLLQADRRKNEVVRNRRGEPRAAVVGTRDRGHQTNKAACFSFLLRPPRPLSLFPPQPLPLPSHSFFERVSRFLP